MNQLSRETSPYLKQHETNPVAWYPWGPEALEKSKREDRPILLSIGYSSCHWCHVMAHESFESEEVAKALNENFISIKVDREERPDLDQVYQNVAQAMTGGGGWPLTVFLMPDLRPFFGGTYFPPEDRYGRPGFLRVVNSLANAYRNDRVNVEENAEKLTAIIRQLETTSSREEGVSLKITQDVLTPQLHQAAGKLLQAVDWQEGGIGGAPKFPNTGIFSFLWRYGKSDTEETVAFEEGMTGNDPSVKELCRKAVILTLTRMAEGGIFDQLGGGFSRYSVDEHWAVPHFEKMLYDNALLLQLYSEVLATDQIASKKALSSETRGLFLETVRKTVTYLHREMKVPGGAFYAAQDADSEGEEGKYFVWAPQELRVHLAEDEARAFELRYGVDEGGNFEHATTVLFQARPVKEVASVIGRTDAETEALIAQASEKLFQAREKRVKPGLDDKTLVSWSSLMISALSFTAETLRGAGEKDLASRCAQAAREAFETIRTLGMTPGGRLLATIQKGVGRFDAYLDDHAFLARAALDLSRVEPERAKELQAFSAGILDRIISDFRDSAEAGYFFVAKGHEELLTRPKSVYDQAIPSGTAVVLSLLQWHVELTEDPTQLKRLREELDFQSESLFAMALKNPYGHGELLCSALQAARGCVLVEASEELLRELSHQPEILPKKLKAAEPALWCSRATCTEVKGSLQDRYWREFRS